MRITTASDIFNHVFKVNKINDLSFDYLKYVRTTSDAALYVLSKSNLTNLETLIVEEFEGLSIAIETIIQRAKKLKDLTIIGSIDPFSPEPRAYDIIPELFDINGTLRLANVKYQCRKFKNLKTLVLKGPELDDKLQHHHHCTHCDLGSVETLDLTQSGIKELRLRRTYSVKTLILPANYRSDLWASPSLQYIKVYGVFRDRYMTIHPKRLAITGCYITKYLNGESSFGTWFKVNVGTHGVYRILRYFCCVTQSIYPYPCIYDYDHIGPYVRQLDQTTFNF